MLHRFPEIGFELDRTIAFLKSELDKMGIKLSCLNVCFLSELTLASYS